MGLFMSRFSRIEVVVAVLVMSGCSGMPDPEVQPPTDSGVIVVDAGTRADAGQQIEDAGVPPEDAGVEPHDAGIEPHDAGTEPHDAGTIVDAGTTFDAGVTVDAGTSTGPINGCPNNDCTANVLIIGASGTTHFGVFEQGPTPRNRPRQPSSTTEYDTCVVSGAFPLNTYFGMVEVRNPTSVAQKVELRVDTAPGGAYSYSYLSAYAMLPTTDSQAAMCLTGINDGCMEPDEDADDDRWPCLAGNGAPTIPANGSIWAYLPLHNPPSQPAGATRISFQLRAKNVTP